MKEYEWKIRAILDNNFPYEGKKDKRDIALQQIIEVAKAQAEISFKAGIKEAVEWIKKESSTAYICDGEYTYDTRCDNQLFIDLGDWQAKFKEWEIDD